MSPITPASAHLVAPSMELVEAYIEARRHADKGEIGQQVPDVTLDAMTQVLKRYIAQANVPSPRGASAYQQFWMIAGTCFIGRVSLRRDIGEPSQAIAGHIAYEVRPDFRRRGFGHRALALGIEELRRQGVGDILILCEADNIGSIKIIEAAGGKLEGTAPHRDFSGRMIRRYWIK